jgi:hypothetical protein
MYLYILQRREYQRTPQYGPSSKDLLSIRESSGEIRLCQTWIKLITLQE